MEALLIFCGVVLVFLIAYQWATVTLTTGVQIGGVSIQGSMTREGVGQLSIDPLLPIAQAGTLTTRTSASVGIVTITAVDGVQTPTVLITDTVTLSWVDVDDISQYRHGCTVTAVTATTVAVSGGTGTDLPIASYVVNVAKEVIFDVNLNGTDFLIFAISSPTETYVDINEVSGTTPSVSTFTLAAGEAYSWVSDQVVTNPFATVNIGSIVMANNSIVSTAQISGGVLYDAQEN